MIPGAVLGTLIGLATFRTLSNVVNWLKLPAYAWLGQLDTTNLTTSLILAPLAPLGIRIGRVAHDRIDERAFYHVVYGSLIVLGAKLIYDGLF